MSQVGPSFVRPCDLLGRHVSRRADECSVLRQPRLPLVLEPAGNSKVHHDRLAPLVDHDVGRFEIAMQDAVRMRLLQRERRSYGPPWRCPSRAAAFGDAMYSDNGRPATNPIAMKNVPEMSPIS